MDSKKFLSKTNINKVIWMSPQYGMQFITGIYITQEKQIISK